MLREEVFGGFLGVVAIKGVDGVVFSRIPVGLWVERFRVFDDGARQDLARRTASRTVVTIEQRFR